MSWEFLTALSSNIHITTTVALVAYVGLLFYGKTISGHVIIGFSIATLIPCLNITAYLTGWLTPEFHPFMPLYITAILIISPFIYLLVSKIFSPAKES